MKIKFENVDFRSNSGPNSFSKKLYKYLYMNEDEVVEQNYDAVLCFIEGQRRYFSVRVQQKAN